MSVSPIGVTDNARLLLGYTAGALLLDGVYALESVDAQAGTQVIVHAQTGNRYLMSIEQLVDTE